MIIQNSIVLGSTNIVADINNTAFVSDLVYHKTLKRKHKIKIFLYNEGCIDIENLKERMAIIKNLPHLITKADIDNNFTSVDENYRTLLRKHKIINILYNEQQLEIVDIKKRLEALERRNK